MLSNKQIADLTIYLKRKIIDELQSRDLSITNLAKAIGAPTSTLSQVLNTENMRLPSILTLIKVARILGKSIDDFVPRHLINFDPEDAKKAISLPANGVFNWVEAVQRIEKYSQFKSVYYHPRNLPDFAKTPRMIQAELGLNQADAVTYTTSIGNMLGNKISGIVVIDEAALIDLMDRTRVYADISRHEAMLCMEKLRDHAREKSQDFQTIVCSRHVEALDPIMIIGDQVAISYCFGRLAIINDKTLINSAIARFHELHRKHPSLGAWLASV